MSKLPTTSEQYSGEPKRRLSFARVMLAVFILVSIPTGIVFAQRQWHVGQPTVSKKPWFASYVDVTATPTYAFDQLGRTSNRDAILSFIVSLPGNACTPSWGAAYTLSQAAGAMDLDRRIARLQQLGGSVAISFGGQKNQELAVNCTNPNKLFNAYQSVVNRYNINTIDLDIEGADLTNAAAASRRAAAIAQLQSQRRAAGKPFAVWVTLPVTPQGLAESGTDAVSQLLTHHVDLAGVNAMTMDFGASLAKGETMVSASENALTQTERQLGILYQRAGVHLNDATLWTKIGMTPMIGQNDISDEVVTLADATRLNHFALSQKVGRMSMWSANRDLACGTNYVNTQIVSDACSGIQQDMYGFASRLGAGFDGSILLSAGLVTKADANSTVAQQPDNPATSPYQIWSPTGAYLKGTKVVWHHNVYQAKWWTQGDVPDDPVLQEWQTPWTLIGPVLPGEKPIPQPTLPAGTYPNWSGTATYDTGNRVLFHGVPYQAKWWNTGQSPAAATSNPDSCPWVPLTQQQINAIVTPTSK
jgi:chitinase